jgi:L-threonylcarbamoyladenylate synthase
MEEEINKAVEFLLKGKTILYPTDTIWGIGCDATSQKAVERIFRIKQRPEKKSLIILLDTEEKIERYVTDVPQLAYDLIRNYSSPLTIIYPNSRGLARNVVADDKSIAIRVVKDEFCRLMIARFGKPVVSTSANVSGEPAPLAFSRIPESVKQGVDYVVRYNQNTVTRTKPSTIIKIKKDGSFDVLRK